MDTPRTMMPIVRAAALCFLVFAGCSKEPPNTGRRLPRLAPPSPPALPADLHIEVVRGDAALPPIDAARLRQTPPDLTDGLRRAWTLRHLLGSALAGVREVEVTGDGGVAIRFVVPHDDTGLRPALWLSRRGTVVAVLLDPDHPFSSYHGEGGRLGRPNDPHPRVEGVRRIRLIPEAKHPAAPSLLRVQLEIHRRGAPVERAMWTRAELESAGTLEVTARGGERRKGWPLRALLAKHVGARARLEGVRSHGGRLHAIAPSLWDDAARIPVLRPMKHGGIAFEWADETRHTLPAGRVRFVEALVVSIP